MHYNIISSSPHCTVQEMIDEGCTLNEKDSKILQEAKFRVHVPSKLSSQAVSSNSQPVQVHRSREAQCV